MGVGCNAVDQCSFLLVFESCVRSYFDGVSTLFSQLMIFAQLLFISLFHPACSSVMTVLKLFELFLTCFCGGSYRQQFLLVGSNQVASTFGMISASELMRVPLETLLEASRNFL